MSKNLEPRVVDLGVACLVCLAEEPEASSIYGHDPESPHMLILDKIRCCTGLQLDSSPAQLQRWPDKICKQCHLELSVSYRFHEKCAAVQKLFHSASSATPTATAATVAASAPLLVDKQQEQLKLDLEQAQVRLPATLKIKRLNVEPCSSSSVSSAITTTTEPSYYEDVKEETEADALSLIPEGAMVLSLNDLQQQDPITQQPEEDSEEQQDEEGQDKMLGLDPWDDETTPEHLYEIETPLMVESVDSPPLPPPPQSTNQLRKRSYRRVSPIVKRERLTLTVDVDDDYKPASATKRRNSERSPKICDVCGNTYKYQHALNAHMRRHNNERPYPCEVCQKAFISNVELRRHMRVHTGQKPYSCRYCERRFSDFGSSKKHERIHTGERPYVCEVCDKGFAYAHVLSVHRRTHTGKKQFQCTQCDKGFTKKSYLSAHMDQHRSSGSGEASGSSSSADASNRHQRNSTRKESARKEQMRKQQQIPEAFSLDSVVLEQTKVLEECIVANDFMFNDEDNAEEEAVDGEELQHDDPYPYVDGYQSVHSVKELVGDLLDTEEFGDESKYMID
ncbi:zinc finger protein 184 [Drosophila teissieri]|uniref:zinc finger protein 184 n=1 Tax=Drosophila teissieri TaxID=7243 RepID=UPI001CBA209C|nr:zinc finger protein 184 [Drosophila teissieri]